MSLHGPVNTYTVAGVPIAAVTASQAAEWLVHRANRRISTQVHLCNAYTISLASRDTALRSALVNADLNLPDGAPVAWLGRSKGTNGPVRGPGLVRDVLEAGMSHDLRHFLYGGGVGVPEAMAARLLEKSPGALIVGVESPPFGDATDKELESLAQRVASMESSILWIGLGTPRQDMVVKRLAAYLTDVVIVPVGAAFDFWAGTVREAPAFIHGTGLEWAHRLMVDPGRLAKRYAIHNPHFLYQIAKGHATRRRNQTR